MEDLKNQLQDWYEKKSSKKFKSVATQTGLDITDTDKVIYATG